MAVKFAITLMLGLVFQLAQVLPAAAIAPPCQMEGESCECCMGGKSCHCAESNDPDPAPTPAPFDASGLLKIPEMKPAETAIFVADLPETEPPALTESPLPTGPVRGFTGVAMSVAFCSFVI